VEGFQLFKDRNHKESAEMTQPSDINKPGAPEAMRLASLELEVEVGFFPVAVVVLLPGEEADELEEVVPFNLWALRWKPSRVSVLLILMLIAPTPPLEHVLKSKNQTVVLESLMVIGRLVMAFSFPAFLKLESKPLIVTSVSWTGTQGAANVDCVTVWFPWVKLKTTTSPSRATKLLGWKTLVASLVVFPPTVITSVFAYVAAKLTNTKTVRTKWRMVLGWEK